MLKIVYICAVFFLAEVFTEAAKFCFTRTCGRIELTECLGETWNCQDDEYCELTTRSGEDDSGSCRHIPGSEDEASRVRMRCQSIYSSDNGEHLSLQNCRELTQKCNFAICDPSNRARTCIWCLEGLRDFDDLVGNTTDSPRLTAPTADQSAVTTSAATQPSTASPTTTAAPATTAAASTAAQCVQCGEYDSVSCTDEETLANNQSPCQGQSPYCLTHAVVDSDGVTSIYKRCFNETLCNTMWYQQTSDNQICLNFDSTSAISDTVCHFCCHGDGCNVNIIPAKSSLYVPIGNGKVVSWLAPKDQPAAIERTPYPAGGSRSVVVLLQLLILSLHTLTP